MHSTNRLIYLLGFCFLLAPLAASAQDAFSALSFLVGNWEAEGKPGEATGHTEFTMDIQGHALVRRNHAEYPPAAGKPAYIHDDLMVVYREVKPVAFAMDLEARDGAHSRPESRGIEAVASPRERR